MWLPFYTNTNVLKLLIQPLVENAIIHGLENKVGNGYLEIYGYKNNNNIIFDIKDDGVGVGNSKKSGEGIGIDNLRKRIKLFYGNN